MKIVVLIPVYNDWQSVFKILDEINTLSIELQYQISIILVNDASTDNTVEVIQKIQKSFNLVSVNNNQNKCQSYSILKRIGC